MSDIDFDAIADRCYDRGYQAAKREMQPLIDAMDQLLDDMGHAGLSVCLAAKAQARVAFEPFVEPSYADMYMPLEEAKRILAECT